VFEIFKTAKVGQVDQVAELEKLTLLAKLTKLVLGNGVSAFGWFLKGGLAKNNKKPAWSRIFVFFLSLGFLLRLRELQRECVERSCLRSGSSWS
jgi:hypothetical protein